MTQPGLLNGLPGGSAPLMAESDPALDALIHGRGTNLKD